MRRSPRFVAASCTAAIVGLGTAFTVAGDLATLHRRADDLGPEETVIVAARDIPLGTIVTDDDIATLTRHASTLPDDAVHGGDAALGRTVAVPLVRDAVVQVAHLAPSDRDGLDGVIPPGRRAVRITPADGSHPRAGSVVDVLAALDPSLLGVADRAIAVARGARVLTGHDDFDSPDTEYGTGGGGGVTLLVTEEEAYDLAFAAANGVLTLAVAPPEAACCSSSEP